MVRLFGGYSDLESFSCLGSGFPSDGASSEDGLSSLFVSPSAGAFSGASIFSEIMWTFRAAGSMTSG